MTLISIEQTSIIDKFSNMVNPGEGISTMAATNDNKMLLVGGNKGTLRILDLTSRQRIVDYSQFGKTIIMSIAASTDNNLLIHYDASDYIKVVSIKTRHCTL